MRRYEIVSDWKKAWRWFSIWAFAGATALQLAYDGLNDDQKKSIKPWVPKITIAILAFGAVGRFARQYPESCKDCPRNKGKKDEI